MLSTEKAASNRNKSSHKLTNTSMHICLTPTDFNNVTQNYNLQTSDAQPMVVTEMPKHKRCVLCNYTNRNTSFLSYNELIFDRVHTEVVESART